MFRDTKSKSKLVRLNQRPSCCDTLKLTQSCTSMHLCEGKGEGSGLGTAGEGWREYQAGRGGKEAKEGLNIYIGIGAVVIFLILFR